MGTKANVDKIEANATWQRNRGRIWTSYSSLPNDSDENRGRTLSEWSLNTGYYMSDHWHSEGNIRYDLSADRTATAGLSLTYENECVQARFEISRRFASSTNLTPSTDLALGVDLRGFGFSGSDTKYTRTCRSN
jgi:LPS-assembly protein